MGAFAGAIQYIIEFLLQDNAALKSNIYYMKKEDAKKDCAKKCRKIYIVRSSFFDDETYASANSLPKLPLSYYEGARIVYGDPKEEWLPGDNLLIYADIIASSYFFLSRYEEFVQSNCRDQYGNYPSRQSVLYLSGNDTLNEPIVDIYGRILCQKLEALGYETKPQRNGFHHIYFTHDIDIPFQQYTLENMLRTTAHYLVYEHRIVLYPLLNWLGYYGTNPQATWKYMLKAEKRTAEQVNVPWESICFIIATERQDSYTTPYINDKKTRIYLGEMRNENAVFGLHTSYEGAENEGLMYAEKKKLESVLGHSVVYHRNHYLRQIQPSDMKRYEQAGFTDDFTTGFNEVAGFRLGTCHPVRFIDPADGSLHEIVLHPLLIMDGSLAGTKPYQMGLDFEQAKNVCKKILNQVWKCNGEVNVLFHNGMFEDSPGNYYKKLYDWMLEYLVCFGKTEKELHEAGGAEGNV